MGVQCILHHKSPFDSVFCSFAQCMQITVALFCYVVDSSSVCVVHLTGWFHSWCQTALAFISGRMSQCLGAPWWALPFPSFPFPFLPLSFPSPCLFSPLFYLFLSHPLLTLRSRFPLIQLRGLGERCKLPCGVWADPHPKSNLVHFSFKIRHLVATILVIFLRINLPNFVQFKQY